MSNKIDHTKRNAAIQGSVQTRTEGTAFRDDRQTMRKPYNQGVDRTVVSAVPEAAPGKGFHKSAACLRVTLSCGHYHRRRRAGNLAVGMTVACAFCKPDAPAT